MASSPASFRNLLVGVAGEAAGDQLHLAQQALGQIRESVVITGTQLDEPGPEIVYVNAAFTKMTGWLPEEVVGKSPRFLQGPKTTRKTLDRLRRQLTRGEAFEGEDINYRKGGSEFWIDCISSRSSERTVPLPIGSRCMSPAGSRRRRRG